MVKKYDYTIASVLVKISGIVFFLQILMETTGILTRNIGYEWVILACGIIFGLSVIYFIVLVLLNLKYAAGEYYANRKNI